MSRPRVAYFLDTDIGGFYYAQHHPMKPHRLSMTYNLCLAYGAFRFLRGGGVGRGQERDCELRDGEGRDVRGREVVGNEWVCNV